MKMISTLGLVLLISLGLAAASEAGEFEKPPSGGVPNQYLVVLDDAAMGLELGAEPEDKARVFETVAADLRRSHSVGRSSLLNRLGILIVETDAKTARRLANDHRVLLVEQDVVGSVSAYQQCYAQPSYQHPLANSYNPTSPRGITRSCV